MRSFYRSLKIISAVTLFFFVWSFLPLWQAVAYAAEGKKRPALSGQQSVTASKLDGSQRFEKTLDDIRVNVGRAEEKTAKDEDAASEVAEVKVKRTEIEKIDSELRKEFFETEKKLKDAKLPQEILDRHYKFVKHYNDNLAELKANLSAIEKPSAKSHELRAALKKAKAHLEKTKAPSKHVPLDPNNLPFRTVKGKERAPRLKKEEFERDFPPQKRQGTKTASTTDEHGWTRINTREAVSREFTPLRDTHSLTGQARIDANGTSLPASPLAKGGQEGALISAANEREWARINSAANGTTDEHGWIPGVNSERRTHNSELLSAPSPLTPDPSRIRLAYNDIASDVPFQLPLPSGERTEVRGGSSLAASPILPVSAFSVLSEYSVANDLTPNSELSTLNLAAATAADLPTAADLSQTPEVQFTPELQQIATLLENNPVQLYEFVRNNFTYDPYYGSVKGSQGTLLLQNGNDFDQASVLIALFRVSGIPARYVYGTVEIPIEKVMKWLGGIIDPRTAGNVLSTNGIPAKLIISGGAIKSVLLEHTWVEVYIPYANYRGLINDPTAPKTWIPLDPSYKLTDPNPNAVDLADQQQFDIDSYLTSYLQTVKPTTPAKDYLTTTINHVTNNMPGQRFYDLLASGPIIDKVLGLIPDTLPYPVRTVGAKFSSVPDTYRHRITLEFTDPNSNETILTYSASWAALLHNRFTISHIPATTVDERTIANYGNIYSTPPYLIKVKPVLKVEGVTVAEGSAVGMAGDIICKMSFYGPRGVLDNVITNNLTVGATHAIGLGSGYTTGRIITYRTAKFEAAATAGETGDPILGEFLYLLAMNYLQELDSSRKLISKSMKILDTYRTTELMVGVDLGVSRIFSIPRSVSINGLLMDVDYNIATPVDMEGNQSKVRRFQILTGMTSSSLEHAVFETIVGAEAVSTIKALQVASTQGVRIHQIDASNITTKLPLLQLGSEVKADIQNAVYAGKTVTVSERTIQLNSWTGVGYIVLDPTTGAGAYMISSGLSGGSLTDYTRDLQYLIRTGEWTLTRAQQEILAHKSKIWFRAPVCGVVTSPYGSRGIGSGFHRGVDFTVEIGTAVMAVADGVVTRAEENHPDYGRVVYIDHGAGVETVYGHNCRLLVSRGQKVYADSSILALSGNTGIIWSRSYQGGAYLPETYPRCVTQVGAHVHFEIRVGGVQQNPQEFNMLFH